MTVMCDVLQVSTAGYYAWRDRPVNGAQQRRDRLLAEIRVVHDTVQARYGSPRIHAELAARGLPCSVNTVAKLMQTHGIAAKTTRKFRHTTDSNHDLLTAANLLDRAFDPAATNEVWTSDLTYIATREGWLYLAIVEDLYSRRVVGWAMSERMTSRLVVDALAMAIHQRLPEVGLLAHSDRGASMPATTIAGCSRSMASNAA